MLNITNITPPRVPLVDPATGMITREWYRFILNLFVLTGSGKNDTTIQDLMQSPVALDPMTPDNVGVLPPVQPATQTPVTLNVHDIAPPVQPVVLEQNVSVTPQDMSWVVMKLNALEGLLLTPPALSESTVPVNGSYTGVGTGFTTTPNIAITYTRIGDLVTIDIPGILATSNSTTMTVTGGPFNMRPTTSKYMILAVQDNGVNRLSIAAIDSAGVITYWSDVTGAAFTATGSKGFTSLSFSYTIN